ncbi:hypothetical protein [Streptomyces sp. NPDC001282]|uniref:hypothetical protein n=1 Tax=Streptomyces sp. NPDC001282 TaxID=3364557 RepID=UPI003692C7FE
MVPELGSALNLIADSTSRADLYVAERTPTGLVRSADPDVARLLDPVLGSSATQGEAIRRLSLLMEVTGEAYLVPTEDGFQVANRAEISTVGGTVGVCVDQDEVLQAMGDPLRIWYPDPERSWLPYSVVLAMEPILENIAALQARMLAISESRAAGNGLVGVPDELNVITPPAGNPEAGVNQPVTNDVAGALEWAMLTPMGDRGDVSAVVPLLLSGPGEHLSNIVRIDLSSPLDKEAPAQLELGLRRMAVSLSLPPELVTGLGATNHWSAATIREEAVTTAFEPRVDALADALTHCYLRPQLTKLGLDPSRYVVAYDLTDLKVRPDRSAQADKAHDEGRLTDEAWARHLGFEVSDMPTGSERTRLLLESVLRRDPKTAVWVLPALGIDVEIPESADAAPSSGVETPEDAEPETFEESAGTEPLERPVTAGLDPEEALLAAVESAVLRVLERTGNRLVGKAPREMRSDLKTVPLTAVHAHLPPMTVDIRDKALQGAFDTWDVHLPWLAPVVRSYVEHLMDSQQPHSQELLREVIAKIDLAALAASSEQRSS